MLIILFLIGCMHQTEINWTAHESGQAIYFEDTSCTIAAKENLHYYTTEELRTWCAVQHLQAGE